MSLTVAEMITRLREMGDPEHVREMERVAINTDQALGISIYDLRKFARQIGRDHALALQLWDTGLHEARLLAGMIADPGRVDTQTMERWVADFDSWDLCDQTCALFAGSPAAEDKIFLWADRSEEFVRRAAFAMIAELAWHDREAPDSDMEKYLPLIASHANDNRNFVKKAVNWALRNIGKRNRYLNRLAVQTAEEIALQGSRPALWIARDAIRELKSESVQARLKN